VAIAGDGAEEAGMTIAAVRPSGGGAGFALLMARASSAHAVSHFHLLTVPALMPFLPARYGVGFVEIAFAMTVFSVVSLFVHIPLGFATDRIGPRPMLVAGLALGSLTFASLAFTDSYAWLLAAMAAAGLANGVYHPAGYALISSQVNPAKVGRAFSIFAFAGFLGSTVTPAALYWTVVTGSIELAFLASASVAGVVALFLLLGPDSSPASGPMEASPAPGAGAMPGTSAGVFSFPIGMVTMLFLLISLTIAGLHSFSVTAMVNGYGLSLAQANWALTGFLFASSMGILAGGMLADQTQHHGYIASGALLLTGVLTGLIALSSPSPGGIMAIMAVAGLLFGVITPSRDMLVRAAAPKGSEGRVFAIVSTGLNLGGIIGPLLFASMLDGGRPRLVFAAVTLFILVATVMALIQEWLHRKG
jgi:MFS family permease